ncbi:MAG: hypothetical protein K0U40_03890 [Betaproteobacteria bacterium]|nr:hypothetical protein [Betaproteobacteria bacterium]
MKKYLIFYIIIVTTALISISVYANEITPINDVKTLTINFDGKEVLLKGITKEPTRIPIMSLKAYVLEDESGEVTILTNDDLPLMNKEITIRGRVESLAIIKGEALGLTVVELERYEYY